MRIVRLGPSVVLFLIFFGIALFEVIVQADWLLAGIFLGLGILFLLADYLPQRGGPPVTLPDEGEHQPVDEYEPLIPTPLR